MPSRFAQKGDILFCVRGATTGRKCWSDRDYAIGRGLAAIQGRDGVCTTEFLWFLLDVVTFELLKRAAGSTFVNLPGAELLKFKVQFPELVSDQKRIAAELTAAMAAVDAARRAARERLAAAEALPAAYLREVFEGAEEWVSGQLGNYSSKIGSGITPRGGQSVYVEEGVPLIRSQNVHLLCFEMKGLAHIPPEQDEAMQMSRVSQDDVLLNITGASIGRVCVVPDDVCPSNVNQHVCIIRTRPEKIAPEFLAAYLASPTFQKFIWDNQAGATRQALTKEMIESFEVPLPSIESQHRIAAGLSEKLAAAEKLTARIREELAAIEALRAALLRQAFG